MSLGLEGIARAWRADGLDENGESPSPVSSGGQDPAPAPAPTPAPRLVKAAKGRWRPCCEAKLRTHPDFKKPFSPLLHARLLASLPVPCTSLPGYSRLPGATPTLRPRTRHLLGGEEFHCGELRGEGGFARVYSARWPGGPEESCVLKVQRPANDWEWHILQELGRRLEGSKRPHLRQGFMAAARCFTYNDGSILVSREAPQGSLLDLINATKVERSVAEPLALHLTAELLTLVHELHDMDFIHADLKPDNFLVRDYPGHGTSAIQLIDFGKSLDLRLMPDDTVFHDLVSTSGLRCVEMREDRPWRHHVDYFGAAATAYCLLFGQYMKIRRVKETGRWAVKGTFKRGWQVQFWTRFFDTLLNLDGGERGCLPSLLDWAGQCTQLFNSAPGMEAGLQKGRDLLMRRDLQRRRRTL